MKKIPLESHILLSEEETNILIEHNKGCNKIFCDNCFYYNYKVEKCKIINETPNIIDNEKDMSKIYKEYNKLKIQKIKEILK